MSSTSYSAQQVGLNLLGSTMSTPTWPSQWFAAVSTTVPTFAKGSAPYWNFTEPADTAYARQLVALIAQVSQPPAAYAMTPNASVTFPTAALNWGSILYLGLFDALSAGNLWFYQPVARVVTDAAVTAGSTTLSSATADFTSADVGQQVYLPDVPVGTTISSVTNTTTAVLSGEASATGSALTLAIATPVTVNASDVLTLPGVSLQFQ
jgi:hypothetical protein